MSEVDVKIDNDSVVEKPSTLERAWIQIDFKGVQKQVEIPFWFLAHLRAMSNVYADTPGLQNQYLDAYQEGYNEGVIVNWLADHAAQNQEKVESC
jgi:hypothetical protein